MVPLILRSARSKSTNKRWYVTANVDGAQIPLGGDIISMIDNTTVNTIRVESITIRKCQFHITAPNYRYHHHYWY
jgi:hypothetical protein